MQDSTYEKTLNTFSKDIFGKEWFQSEKLVEENLSGSTISKINASVKQFKTKSKFRINDSTVIDTLLALLSSSELKLLTDELNEKGKAWLTSRFKNIIIVKADTSHSESSHIVFNYSKPFFFRNNNFCLFYKSDYCGRRCASRELAIYQKGKWQMGLRWIPI
jgi:hypothetical protein